MREYTVAGVVIEQNGRYLMVQEKNPKCYGQWNWPAGWVDAGETPEQAAVREAKEEVGLDVILGQKIGEWTYPESGRTNILYKAEGFDGTVLLQEEEILGSAWLTKNEVVRLRDSMRLADWSVDIFENGTIT